MEMTETTKTKTEDAVVIDLETDYLVVGAGAMGMSFVDELLRSDKRVTAILIDERSEAGGQWHSAYPFVKLHQSSLVYGVDSLPLSCIDASSKDKNDGLSSREEILLHFREALHNFVRTGRVRWFPKCRYNHSKAENSSSKSPSPSLSLVRSFSPVMGDPNGRRVVYNVKIRRKHVDATFTKATIGSERLPNFAVEPDGVRVVPINDLDSLGRNVEHINRGKLAVPSRYVIIGNGKTGIDAILYLLDKCHVEPENISWIISRDCWLINRRITHPTSVLTFLRAVYSAVLMESTKTVDDFYIAAETEGLFLRLDETIMPSISRFATIDHSELQKVRSVGHTIRKGRIRTIEKSGTIVFDSKETLSLGEIVTGHKTTRGDDASAAVPVKPEEVLFVDCSANGVWFPAAEPVWQGGTIRVQFVLLPPPGQSASLIAALELALPDDEARKNAIFSPRKMDNPHPPTSPATFLVGVHFDQIQREKCAPILGGDFQAKRRSCLRHHLSACGRMKLMFFFLGESRNVNKKFKHKVLQLLKINVKTSGDIDDDVKASAEISKTEATTTANGSTSVLLGIVVLAIGCKLMMKGK